MKRRAVITGLGVVSPLGCTVEKFWAGIRNGQSGISRVTAFDTTPYGKDFGGEIRDLSVVDGIFTEGERRVYGRSSQLAILATYQALADAGLLGAVEWEQLRLRTAVIMGTTFGEAQIVERAIESLVHPKGEERWPTGTQSLAQYNPNLLGVNIGKRFRCEGANYVIPTACAAANHAIAFGVSLIKSGKADLVIAGGSDPFSQVAFSGFARLGVMADVRCQPFDKNRKGMLVAEGAGIVILEEYGSAVTRGSRQYAEVLGYGLSCDAQHMTIPSAEGMVAAIEHSLQSAALSPRDVDYVCAHGTGTLMNDKTESRAIRSIFYEHGNCVPVSSIKSMIGHSMGAASALETIASVLAIQHGQIPPTINYETRDPECDIDCVPNNARTQRVRYVLNNSFAFGGNNACVVLAET